jgi:hypothetical protein
VILWFMSTRLGQGLAAAAAVVVALLSVYTKARRDGRAAERSEAKSDALKRTQDAIRSGDRASVSPDRLRDDDGFRRD